MAITLEIKAVLMIVDALQQLFWRPYWISSRNGAPVRIILVSLNSPYLKNIYVDTKIIAIGQIVSEIWLFFSSIGDVAAIFDAILNFSKFSKVAESHQR